MLRLTQLRTRRGLSKAALARLARIDQSTVSKIELSRVTPYPIELARLARALGIAEQEASSLMDRIPTVATQDIAEAAASQESHR